MTAEPDRLEQLQAYVDDELPPAERAEVERLVRSDDRARAELAVLSSVRTGLDELARDLPPKAEPRRYPFGMFVLLGAAAAIVVTIALITDPSAAAGHRAENDAFAVRLLPRNGGHGPIYSDLGFTLEITSKSARDPVVVPWSTEEERALAAQRVAAGDVAGELPLVIEAEIEDPEGRRFTGRVAPRAVPASSPHVVAVSLWHIFVEAESIDPLWSVRPLEAGGWQADYRWTFGMFGRPPKQALRRFVPSSPGVHRVRLTVRGLTGHDALQPVAPPLHVETSIVVDGVATAWSEPVEGLRARLVVPTTTVRAGATVPLALQLENVGSRGLIYNVVATTLAPIPQPYCMNCYVDGQQAAQPGGVPVVIPSFLGGLEQPPGTRRCVIVNPEVWTLGGERILSTPGEHRLQLELHTQLLIDSGDPRNWQGRVRTPELTMTVRS